MSETIDFKFNKPELLTLAYADGRNVPSRYPGSIRIMRTTVDQKVFFCDPQLEAKIKALVPVQGMHLQITKLEREGARKGFDWKVDRVGEQPDKTYIIPKIPKADLPTSQRIESASVDVTGNPVAIDSPKSITQRGPQTEAEAHCRRLVDLTAQTMEYAAAHHGGHVTRDDARAIAITVYIQAGRSGRLRWNPRRGERRAG